ncbi:MAG: glycerol kinase GlpK [Bacillota bacterium]
MYNFILALDQSTSGTKAIIFNNKGELVKRVTVEHKQYYPQTGWVEHDPEEIYDNTIEAIKQVLDKSSLIYEDISAISITNQRETVVVWDKKTDRPISNAAVWQCQRGKKICQDLINKGYQEIIKEKTGLIVDPYYSASKIQWMLDNIKGARKKAETGQLLFGTMDSWLIYNMTGGRIHVTDPSNACRTMLFNICDLEWDQELFDIFDIPIQMAPEIKKSDNIFAYTDKRSSIKTELPISGVMGDSHAALFGQGCFESGMAKTTYGTGSSIMMNTGQTAISSANGLVTSIAWGVNDSINYVLEGNVHYTGATIKWLIDDLGIVTDVQEAEILASKLDNNQGVYFVPAFSGLGAPYWDNDARAIITGMSAGSGKAHIVRAAQEAIAYQIKDVLDLMKQDAAVNLKKLRVDGGPTNNKFLMQFQANILDIAIGKNQLEEVSALGSAFAAGLALDIWNDLEQITTLINFDKTYNSNLSQREREKLYRGWKKAVKKARV